jgi:uncharacterized membrane protein
MKKHFALTCLAYLAFGVGFTVQQLGIKAGLGLYPSIIIFTSCLIFFAIIMFTSMEKVKRELFKNDVNKVENKTL